MGLGSSVLIIIVSVLIIGAIVYLLGSKYSKSEAKLKKSIDATNDRVLSLESTIVTQGRTINSIVSKTDVMNVKIEELQASKLPISNRRSVASSTQTTSQNDPAMTLLTTAAVVSTFDSTPSYSSGSCSSSDSGSSYDSSSSCSSSSDSY